MNARVLRRLFLTLFLRGRGSRGLQHSRLPTSVPARLGMTLLFYALFGLVSFALISQSILAISVYLHVTTFMFIGLFVASSAGEILFNKDEADILLHRPVSPRELLWAKIAVLAQVSVWLAAAFNLAGFYVGMHSPQGDWRFPVAHAASTVIEAFFCCGCVVLTYQLCLRWFGRERLESLMTATQVVVSVALVISGQLLPRVLRLGLQLKFDAHTWWVALLPPAWFAGVDDAFAGSSSKFSWVLAAAAFIATAVVLSTAIGRLAQDYAHGLQSLNEAVSAPPASRQSRHRWIEALMGAPPLRWLLHEPAERVAFSLSMAYLLRDREVKLRIYPSVASLLAVPVFSVFGNRADMGRSFLLAFGGAMLGLVPMTSTKLLQYSQQWQAADLFRMAPVSGPAPFCRGASYAVQCVLTVPIFCAIVALTLLTRAQPDQWLLLLPGLITLPVYSMIPVSDGEGVPLSRPGEGARSASRGLVMMVATFVALGVALLAGLSMRYGWFWEFVGVESVVAIFLYVGMWRSMDRVSWRSLD